MSNIKDDKAVIKSVALILIAFFAYSFIEGITWKIFEIILSEKAYEEISYYIVDSVLCIVAVIFFATFMYYINKRDYIDIFRFKDTKLNIFWLLPACVIITFGISGITNEWLYLVYEKFDNLPFFKQSIESYDSSWGGIDEEPYFFVFLSVVFIGPLLEELMFRGVIFNIISKQFGNMLGVIFSGLIFGIWHMELIQSVYTALFGMALAIVYLVTKSIIFPFFCHFIYNFFGTLPPQLNTDRVINIVDAISFACVIPAVIIIVMMGKYLLKQEKEKELIPEEGVNI